MIRTWRGAATRPWEPILATGPLGGQYQGHVPFGLRQAGGVDDGGNDTRWYRLPTGKGLPTAPPGTEHCGTRCTGWLSGWPAGDEGQPDVLYDTPSDGLLPPPVGQPPAVGTVCFDDGRDAYERLDHHTCYSPTLVRAVSCGAFALWELPPTPSDVLSGYCLAGK